MGPSEISQVAGSTRGFQDLVDRLLGQGTKVQWSDGTGNQPKVSDTWEQYHLPIYIRFGCEAHVCTSYYPLNLYSDVGCTYAHRLLLVVTTQSFILSILIFGVRVWLRSQCWHLKVTVVAVICIRVMRWDNDRLLRSSCLVA